MRAQTETALGKPNTVAEDRSTDLGASRVLMREFEGSECVAALKHLGYSLN